MLLFFIVFVGGVLTFLIDLQEAVELRNTAGGAEHIPGSGLTFGIDVDRG